MRETVYIDREKHEIEAKPVTLVFNSQCSTFYPDRIMIDPEMTLNKFSELSELNALHVNLFSVVAPDIQPVTLESLRGGHIGFKHLMGLIVCSLELILIRKAFGWKWPETYLHPKYQGNLADLAILLSSREKFVALVNKLRE